VTDFSGFLWRQMDAPADERYLSGPLFEGIVAGVAEAKAGDTL
jgi:hypothetical protein